MLSVIEYKECYVCGESTSIEYGFKLSWGIKDLNIGEQIDERFFCSLECMRRWMSDLSINGIEDIIYESEPLNNV